LTGAVTKSMNSILLTVGEPAGIGPDCILRAWQDDANLFDDVIIVAPACWLRTRAAEIGIAVHISEYSCLPSRADGDLHCWNPLPQHKGTTVLAGKPAPATAAAVIDCIRQAAQSCLRHEAAAMVTAPIEKAVLRDAGFRFPGHTEFLAALAGDVPFAMMLASDRLRIALLTTHVALQDAPALLTTAHSLQVIRIVQHDLQKRFGIDKPRLALCALNPHAGEQGHFGEQERTILQPAVEQARQAGIDIAGPIAADTAFSPAIRTQFDTIICCYHDQGLIPLKTLSFGEAVNITLGLPFIRTSVDHGTALDKVGSSEVSHSSLAAAITMARDMAARQTA